MFPITSSYKHWTKKVPLDAPDICDGLGHWQFEKHDLCTKMGEKQCCFNAPESSTFIVKMGTMQNLNVGVPRYRPPKVISAHFSSARNRFSSQFPSKHT